MLDEAYLESLYWEYVNEVVNYPQEDREIFKKYLRTVVHHTMDIAIAKVQEVMSDGL